MEPLIITLTTDYGDSDYYSGLLKGTIYQAVPHASIVSITHQIRKYDIIHAAYVMKNAVFSFPRGCIHLVDVNNLDIQEVDMLLCVHRGHYFIGPDNGLFFLLFDGLPEEIYVLPPDSAGLYNFKGRASRVAQAIYKQKPLGETGKKVNSMRERIGIQPVSTRDQIRASVIHIDHFDNAVTNVTRQMFEKVGLGRAFELYYKRSDPITQLSRNYHDVSIGEVLCHFNEAGYLEIAINMGSAATLLGLEKDTAVQIDFL